MKKYFFAKTVTKGIILLSSFAIISSLGIYFVLNNTPKADLYNTTCEKPPVINVTQENTTSEASNGTIIVNFLGRESKQYDFQITAENVQTHAKFQEYGRITAVNMSETKTLQVPPATYNLKVSFTGCNGFAYNNNLSIEAVACSEYNGSGLGVSAENSTVKGGDPINVIITNPIPSDVNYTVYMSTDSNPGEDANKWPVKAGGSIGGGATKSVPVTTSSSTTVGTHYIRVAGRIQNASCNLAKQQISVTISGSGETSGGPGYTPDPNEFSGDPVIGQIGDTNIKPRDSTDLDGLIRNILNQIFIVIGALSIIGIMIGGIQYISAAGDPNQAAKGSKTLLYSIIGVVVALLSLVIINVVVNTIKNNIG